MQRHTSLLLFLPNFKGLQGLDILVTTLLLLLLASFILIFGIGAFILALWHLVLRYLTLLPGLQLLLLRWYVNVCLNVKW